jgi:hypothetical protein
LGEAMSLRYRFVLAFVAVMLLLSIVSARLVVFGLAESDAASAVSAAEEKVVLCYDAVAEADAAGANVTALLATLDRAGEFLSKAELSYRMGDFDLAASYADQSQGELDGFVVEAGALADMAVQESYLGFLVVVGSAVGAVGVVCGGFAVWFLLKKREEAGGVAK